MIKMLQTILIFTVAVLGIVTNNRGLLGLLPVIASVGYTILILKTDSVNWVRIGLAVNNFLWIIYDLIIQNYVNAVIGIFTVVSCIYNLVRHRVDKC